MMGIYGNEMGMWEKDDLMNKFDNVFDEDH